MIAVHDFLHVPNIFGNVVPVIPAGVIDPLRVVLVELALVVRREPARALRES